MNPRNHNEKHLGLVLLCEGYLSCGEQDLIPCARGSFHFDIKILFHARRVKIVASASRYVLHLPPLMSEMLCHYFHRVMLDRLACYQ